MNYREDAVLKNILYDEFVPLFEQQYPDHPWREVEVRRHKQCNTCINYTMSPGSNAVDCVTSYPFTQFVSGYI